MSPIERTGAALGLILTVLALWGQLGWETKKAYAKDHENRPTLEEYESISKKLDILVTAMERNEAHWECYELSVEIPELLVRISETEDEAEVIRLTYALDKKRDKEQKLNCTQFAD